MKTFVGRKLINFSFQFPYLAFKMRGCAEFSGITKPQVSNFSFL